MLTKVPSSLNKSLVLLSEELVCLLGNGIMVFSITKISGIMSV